MAAPTLRAGHSVWANGMRVALCGQADFDEANALLIAAAPDFEIAALKALPLLVMLGDFIGNAHGRCDVISELKDALRKAGHDV